MGDEAYKEVEEEFERRRWSEEEENKEDEEMEEGPYEKEERKRWREEEEKAREAYFLEIRQEEERGIYRQTVAELIEEESAARKLGKKIKREEEGEETNSEPKPLDSPTSNPSDASTQENNPNNSQAVVKSQRTEEDKSTKVKDGGLETGDTGQMVECSLNEEEVRRTREEEKK